MKAPAIALDGCVEGPSKVSAAGPHASFNHHEGVDRLSTRATCEQVLLSVAQGLWDQMLPEGEPQADVHVNDADPDVCTALWVLDHPELADHPAVQRLVAAEGILDTTGAYWCPPWVDENLLAELAWVFEPYHVARDDGPARRRRGAAPAHHGGVGAHQRLRRGQGGAAARPGASSTSWPSSGSVAAIVESGPYARMAVGRAGIQAVVAERESAGRRIVTLAKSSPFVPVDLVDAYRVPQRDRSAARPTTSGAAATSSGDRPGARARSCRSAPSSRSSPAAEVAGAGRQYGAASWSRSSPTSTSLARIGLALLLGGLVGLDRELSHQPAGLRTHITVALGAALFGVISVHGFDAYVQPRADSNYQVDVTRVASQVVVGIGFLGAGRHPQGGGDGAGPDHRRQPVGHRRRRVWRRASGAWWRRRSPPPPSSSASRGCGCPAGGCGGGWAATGSGWSSTWLPGPTRADVVRALLALPLAVRAIELRDADDGRGHRGRGRAVAGGGGRRSCSPPSCERPDVRSVDLT